MSRATVLLRGTGGGAISQDAPVGTVSNQKIESSGNKWLECNGSLIQSSLYPELAPILAALVTSPTGWNLIAGVPNSTDVGKCVVFSPDNSLLFFGTNVAGSSMVLRTSNWSIVSTAPTVPALGAVFSPDGTRLAIITDNESLMRVYNTTTWALITGTPTVRSNQGAIAYSPDGTKLAMASQDAPYLRVYNTADWTLVSGTPTVASEPNTLAFSPNGTKLAVGIGPGPYLYIANTSDWSLVTVAAQPAAIQRLAWNPAGTQLATSVLGSTRILNTTTWALIAGAPTAVGTVYGFSYSADGTLLALVSATAPHLRVYNTADWTVVSGIPTIAQISSALGRTGVAFSPNQRYLATISAATSTTLSLTAVITVPGYSPVAGFVALPISNADKELIPQSKVRIKALP
jgi:WD40 repeat protein